MKTGYQKLDAARDGVGAAASVEFTTYANTMPASQEEAPYLGRAQPGATADQAEVASLMVKRGCQMGAAEIVRIWNETAFHVKDTLLEGRALALDLGFVRLYPAISGTFPTDDAGTVPVTLEETTPSDDGRQRFHGHLAQPVDACEGATLWLWTHGVTPETELYPVHSDKLTVLAGDVPPVPPPTGPTVTAIDGGEPVTVTQTARWTS